MVKKFVVSLQLFAIIFSVCPRLFAKSSTAIETGLSVGTPSGINLALGIWGSSSMPLLLHVSGMTTHKLRGAEAHIGWIFDREGALKQYLAAGASATDLGILVNDGEIIRVYGLGPFYGLNWHGLTLRGGVIFGAGGRFPLKGGTIMELVPPYPRFSIGYSVFW